MSDKINSLDEYVKAVVEDQRRLREERIVVGLPQLSYRGHSDSDYLLIPSLGRFIPGTKVQWINEEANIIQTAKSEHYEVFKNSKSPLEDLSLLQHYGLPTRLLDITQNALVALFFACCSNDNKDGEVLEFAFEYAVSGHYIAEALADSYRLAPYDKEPLSRVLEKMIKQPYYIPDASPINILEEKDIVGSLLRNQALKVPRVVNPPKLTVRQIIQDSRYIVFPNRLDEDNYIYKTIDIIDKESAFVRRRLIIKSSSKKEILRDLEVLGITHEKLFKDDIDRSFSYIKQKLRAQYIQ